MSHFCFISEAAASGFHLKVQLLKFEIYKLLQKGGSCLDRKSSSKGGVCPIQQGVYPLEQFVYIIRNSRVRGCMRH